MGNNSIQTISYPYLSMNHATKIGIRNQLVKYIITHSGPKESDNYDLLFYPDSKGKDNESPVVVLRGSYTEKSWGENGCDVIIVFIGSSLTN